MITRRQQASVDEDWGRAQALGVTAVPTFVIDGHGVVGEQPFEALEQLVIAGGARRRA